MSTGQLVPALGVIEELEGEELQVLVVLDVVVELTSSDGLCSVVTRYSVSRTTVCETQRGTSLLPLQQGVATLVVEVGPGEAVLSHLVAGTWSYHKIT